MILVLMYILLFVIVIVVLWFFFYGYTVCMYVLCTLYITQASVNLYRSCVIGVI